MILGEVVFNDLSASVKRNIRVDRELASKPFKVLVLY